jgi:hypothetical protein
MLRRILALAVTTLAVIVSCQDYDEETVSFLEHADLLRYSTVLSRFSVSSWQLPVKVLLASCSDLRRPEVLAVMQSVGDSCRHLTEMQWRTQDAKPSEIVDELNYRCGDPATQQEASAANFPINGQTEFLDSLLQPAVVRHRCYMINISFPADMLYTLAFKM